MTKIVIINGTNSGKSRVNAVQHYINQKVTDVSSIEVYKLPAHALVAADYTNEEIIAANEKVEKADVIIVLTPVYKAAYSGILKTYLDLIPQKGLQGKVVLPIAVGGSVHHLLAIEYALKPILSALGATNILQGIYIIDKDIERIQSNFLLQENVRARIDEQLKLILNYSTIS